MHIGDGTNYAFRRDRTLATVASPAHPKAIDNLSTTYDHRVLPVEPNSLSKWNMLETLRLAEETKLARQAITRLENAILELPEELAPAFRDELHHIRDTYGDQ